MDGNAQAPAYRAPPANIEAEQALLGAILINNNALARVADFLRPEHFSEGVHGRIYAAITALVDKGSRADPVTLKTIFDQDSALTDIGGSQYLVRLATSAVTLMNAADYGRVIVDLFRRRQMLALLAETEEALYLGDLDRSADQIIRETEEGLYAITDTGGPSKGLVHIDAIAWRAIEQAETAFKRQRTSGIPTGLADLDRMIGGLMPGELTVIGARPSMGKTTLAAAIAKHAARHFIICREEWAEPARSVAFYSVEMPAAKLAARDLADISGISADRQRRGDILQDDFAKLLEAKERLARLPYFIDETPQISVSQVRQKSMRLARRHGLGLIVVDHLQKMRQSGRVENRRLEIGEITGGLASIAKELNVPVVLLSQLSRAVEQRDDKRPTLGDLRESGDIEQDADVVMFLYREQYYLERAEPQRRPEEADLAFDNRHSDWSRRLEDSRGITEIIVAKNRDGQTGSQQILFNAERSRFDNLVKQEVLL